MHRSFIVHLWKFWIKHRIWLRIFVAPLLCCCTLFDVEIIHSPDIDTPLIYHNITASAPLISWNLNTFPLTTTGTGGQQQPDWLIKLPTIVSHFPWRLMAHHLDMGIWDEDFKWSVSEIGKWRIEERGYKKLFWQNSGDIASRKVRSFFFWCWNFSV